MFGTPTSTVGSIFDIMRSPSSATSQSHCKNKESIAMNGPSSVLSRPSKSSSVASFNSSRQYQPSSCSTYSASTPAVAGSPPDIFKRQYVTQAIRLVDDALMEQEKGSCCDESYAFDCYLGSLEYLLSAVSTETNLHRQIGSVARQEIIHAKLSNLIRCTEEFSCPSHEGDSTLQPTEPTTGWWNGVWGRTYSTKNAQDSPDILVSTPSELAAQCDCGRKVLVKIPEYFLSDQLPDSQPEPPKIERRNFFAAWYSWALNLVYVAISLISGFVIPFLFSFFIRTTISIIVYIEHRFEVVNFILNVFVSIIKLLLKISQDYNFNKQLGDFFSWLISKLVKIALTFVKADDIKNLNILFDLNSVDINVHQDSAKNRGDAHVGGLTSFRQKSQTPISHHTNSKFNSGGTSSSSRFSVKSDSTCQLNRQDQKSSPLYSDKSPNSSYSRTRRYNF